MLQPNSVSNLCLQVPLVTPNGEVLLEDLTLQIPSGAATLCWCRLMMLLLLLLLLLLLPLPLIAMLMMIAFPLCITMRAITLTLQ